jgi:alpha-galactosidase
MGWNTWCTNSTCGHDVCTEHEIKRVASSMIESGLAASGWTHVALDDCWEDVARDPSGSIRADPSRFPSGMPALAAWLHARNLSFGIYTSLGYSVCNLGGHAVHPPGSFGHEAADAATFAAMGVDVVKGDDCDMRGENLENATRAMSQALAATGRPLWFYFHCDGEFSPWCPELGQSSRVAPDHCDGWTGAACPLSKSTGHGTLDIIDRLRDVGKYSGLQPSGRVWFADWDLLMIGGQACNDTDPHGCAGQSDEEYRTEFSFWSLASSPLLLATDPRVLTPVMREALFNAELIAVNQAPPQPGMGLVYVRPAACGGAQPCEVWVRPPGADGNHFAILFNPNAVGSPPVSITLEWADLGGLAPGATARVRDLWRHADLGSFTGSYTTAADVAPHEARTLKVSAV